MTNETTSLFAAEALLREGVKKVFVSLGGDGIVAAEGSEIIKLPCETTEIVNCTGCGDAATAAIIWAGVNGLGIAESASAAMKAAAMCAASSSGSAFSFSGTHEMPDSGSAKFSLRYYASVNYSTLHNSGVHNVCRARSRACKTRIPL